MWLGLTGGRSLTPQKEIFCVLIHRFPQFLPRRVFSRRTSYHVLWFRLMNFTCILRWFCFNPHHTYSEGVSSSQCSYLLFIDWGLKPVRRQKAHVVTVALECQKSNVLETKFPSFSRSKPLFPSVLEQIMNVQLESRWNSWVEEIETHKYRNTEIALWMVIAHALRGMWWLEPVETV